MWMIVPQLAHSSLKELPEECLEQFRAEKVCGGCEAWARRCEVVPEIVDPNANEDPNASDMNNEETTISTTTEFSPVRRITKIIFF